MSKNKQRILIIDDSTDDIHFVMENLKQHYAILVATSGKKGIALAQKEPQPDVILLDVMMPEMDGYETCRQLKSNPLTKNIDVIFISAHHDIAEKLKGYDVGGRDYLNKPVQPEELLTKVRLTLENQCIQLEAQFMRKDAIEIALASLTIAGELGVIISCMQELPLITNLETLAHAILDALKKYTLEATIQIRVADKGNDLNMNSSSQSITQIELDIFAHYKDNNKCDSKSKIIEKGQYCIFTFNEISLLVKNMPNDDAKRGRFRDNICILLEAAFGKLTALKRDQKLLQIVCMSQGKLEGIRVEQDKNKQKSQSIMNEMLDKITSSFDFWGLTEEQEGLMLQILHHGIDNSVHIFERGEVMDKNMHKILQRIFDVVKVS